MNVYPPAGLIDHHPERGPWVNPARPPVCWSTVEIMLRDGQVKFATWTGTDWWRGKQYLPIGWRKIPGVGLDADAQ